jgi:ATP phosphoribosyltransferase
MMNGLKEVEVLMKSEASLIANQHLPEPQTDLLQQLMFRIKAVQAAERNKYILLNIPTHQVPALAQLLPGMKSPTVLPLLEPGWSSVHSVVPEDEFWKIVDQVRELGAQGILVIPIEKMVTQ